MAFWINIYECQLYPKHGHLSVNQLKNDSYCKALYHSFRSCMQLKYFSFLDLFSFRFKSLFVSCKDEKLVSYYSCSWWKGRFPSRGWMYLTENNLAFYSYTFGKEAKLLLRWTDVTKVEKTNNYVRPDSIRVATRESEYVLVFRLPKRDVRSGAGGGSIRVLKFWPALTPDF